MTRIEEIRQRARKRRQVEGFTACGQDVAALLDEWDTRDAALRALVEQLEADSAKAQESAKAATDIVAAAGWIARSTALFTSACDVLRLLEHEP